VKEARANAPRRQPVQIRAARSLRRNSDQPLVTYALIGVSALVFVAQLVFGDTLTNWLLYFGPATFSQPWRIVTSLFAHGSPLHLIFNMYSLFVLGRLLEPAFGHARFAALYFISGLGGSIAVLLLAPSSPVLGASGAIFGLLGALLVIVRRLGGNTAQLLVVFGLNVVIGFIVPGIAWQAHIGGALVGAALAAIYVRTRSEKHRVLQAGLFVAVAGALVLAAVLRFAVG
jgi:membrane associated rhomboid family serine protease